MRRLLAIAVLSILAACAPAPEPLAPAPEPPISRPTSPDTCGIAQFERLIGVHESEIDRASLPPRTRIICPTCIVTQDYSESRLKLMTDTQGRVSSLRCF